MPAMPDYDSVEDYFNAQTEETRNALLVLRKCILKAVPEIKEQITYKNPGYALTPASKKSEHIRIAGYKEHVSFYPSSKALQEFAKDLEPFQVGRGTVQFSFKEAIPEKLIERIVQWQYTESITDNA